MAKLKELHPQYVTDEEGRRTSVILPIVEFEELLATVKDSASVVESQEESAVEQAVSLSQRRAYMKLPLEERRRRLAAQADQLAEHYEQATERAERELWQGGDIVESIPTASTNTPRIAGLHSGAIQTVEDFDEPMPGFG